MRWISLIFLGLVAQPVLAHPHVFIDSGLRLVFDSQGRLAAVRVSWAYDELFSLLQLEELGLDPDGDGVLSDEERAKIAGFDTDWIEGFEGDIYLTVQGRKIALGAPANPGAHMDDGRLVTWHTRPLVNRHDPAQNPVEIKVFDPTYYTAYTTDGGVQMAGRSGCKVSVQSADIEKAYDKVEELLDGASAAGAEMSFPAVGELFADIMMLECASGS